MQSLAEHRFERIGSIGLFVIQAGFRKRGGVLKSMANKVPWKIGLLIYLPVTSRPLIFLQKEAVLSPCNQGKKAHKHKLFSLVNVQMALGQTAGCPRVDWAKKFMCSP